jgi:DNA (cytosine-5)-methyltransferase 1
MRDRLQLLDLFSGIGGFSLGLERAGMKTVAFCEIDPNGRRVLAKHWPGVPIYDDVRKLDAARLRADGIGRIDAICGGFPCQDISNSGQKAGIDDGERSGLWKHYARLVGELRPQFVIVENVAALLGRGLGRVLGDLAAIGYDAEWHCIPACAVGAPHIRDRIWIVAYPSDRGFWRVLQPQRECGSEVEANAGSDGEARPMADAHRNGPPQRRTDERMGWGWLAANDLASSEARTEWSTEPDLPRVAAGIPNRLHRLRGLGNSIVPRIAETIGRAIMRATGS